MGLIPILPLEGGFQVFDDLLRQDVRVREVVGVFETFISEPEDVEASFVAVDEFLVVVGALPTIGDIKKVET